MATIVGIGLAILTAIFGRLVGLDRDRAFYAVVLVVVGSYYALFAVIGGISDNLIAETIGAALFAATAAIGFRTTLWIVAAGLGAHGIFDFFHHSLVANPGVPTFWPSFCLAFDVAAGTLLAVLLARGDISARGKQGTG